MAGETRPGDRSGGQGRRTTVWGGAAALMLAPVVASRVSDEMAWSTADFLLAAIVLAAACGVWEIALLKSRDSAFAAGALAAAGTAFLLFAVNGAVGLIGTEDDPVNLLFFGVLTSAFAGSVVIGFKPVGMARTMAVTACVQVAAGAVALLIVPDVRGFALGSALFVPLWLLSSWLFARSAREG